MGNFRQWCSSSIPKLKKTDKTRMCNTEAISLLTLSSILLREIAICFIIVSYKRNASTSLFNIDL